MTYDSYRNLEKNKKYNISLTLSKSSYYEDLGRF